MANPLFPPIARLFDENGDPLAGGKVYFYEAGTDTPKDTYTDATMNTLNSNPVILDSEGYATSGGIWGEGFYRIRIFDSNDVQQGDTIDNYTNDSGETGPAGSFQMSPAAGTVDAITADYSPNITLSDTTTVGFVSAGENTSTTPTFAPDGLTARTIVKRGGVALVAGDIGPAGSVHFLEYNAANTRWELANPISAGKVANGILQTADTTTPFVQGTGTTASATSMMLSRFGNNNGPNQFFYLKSRNSTPGSQTVLASADVVMLHRAYGSDGTNFIEIGQHGIRMDGTPGTNDMPGSFFIKLTPDGSATLAEVYHITNAGIPRYPLMHNNASAMGTALQPGMRSGTYTPTLFNGTNVAASTSRKCLWYRVGNIVTVTGSIDIDPTTSGLDTDIDISIPVASNFATSEDLSGNTATTATAGQCGGISANTTNDRATLSYVAASAANRRHFFTFSYEVLA
jgi:hypothetical protein